jgi:hypothetical protein
MIVKGKYARQRANLGGGPKEPGVSTRPEADRPRNLLAGNAITLPAALDAWLTRNSVIGYPDDLTNFHRRE